MKILSLLLLVLSFNLQAQSLDEKLSADLNKLQSQMSASDVKQQASDLLNNDGRVTAFRLQAYGRLFENVSKDLKKFKEDFKELEDKIGQCAKWNDLLKKSTDANKNITYKTNLNQDLEKLSDLLSKWERKDKINDFKAMSSNINLNAEKTLKIADKNISSEIKDIINKKYDFTYGETGLHELRRNVRWPKIYFELFSDQIILKKSTCTPSKNNLYQEGKGVKAIVFKGASAPLAISVDECAYTKLVGAVELLGDIKNGLEKAGVLDDKLPKAIKDQTNSIYNELITEILPRLL